MFGGGGDAVDDLGPKTSSSVNLRITAPKDQPGVVPAVSLEDITLKVGEERDGGVIGWVKRQFWPRGRYRRHGVGSEFEQNNAGLHEVEDRVLRCLNSWGNALGVVRQIRVFLGFV